MHAPINQGAASCNSLCCEIAAESRNGTEAAKADIAVKDFAKLAGINEFFDVIDRGVETVAHADVEHLAALVLRLLHLQRFGIGSGGRLFTQNMLSSAQQITGDGGVRKIGGADGDGLYLRIVQNRMVIRDCRAATVFFDGL